MNSSHLRALYRKLRLPMLVFVAILLFGLRTTSWADIDQISEQQIKAAYLYNFVKYIDWPAVAPGRTSSKLNICILGKPQFGEALSSFEGKIIKGRRIEIMSKNRVDDIKECDILYICPSEKNRITQILASVSSRSILTISSSKHFISTGGMISFVVINDKIRFEINRPVAQSKGLLISAQLLKLASRVIE